MARVLIVDDEPRIRDLIREHLQYAGFTCAEAGDGTQALAELANGGIDLVILDIMMPGKSGLEVLSEWTESIHHQIERLNSLVTQLLTLAKWRKVAENWS